MTLPASIHDRVLDLWAAGNTAREVADLIADDVACSSYEVMTFVLYRRKKGEARALSHPKGPRNGWPEERSERLRELWDKGLSCSLIAEQLGGGISRNSVIGRAHRMGLCRKSPIIRTRRIVNRGVFPKPPKPRRVKESRFTTAYFHTPGETPQPIAEAPPPPECTPVTLLQRTLHQCAWVVGEPKGPDTLMCGAPVALDQTWCTYHVGIGHGHARQPWTDAQREKIIRTHLANKRKKAAALLVEEVPFSG